MSRLSDDYTPSSGSGAYGALAGPNAWTGTQDFTGATVTGIAGGGSSPALTRTAVKTAAYTAAAYDLVPVDTTSGAVTITLPAAPANKTQVAVKHVIQGSTNAVTVACGGSDVLNKAGGSTSLTLSLVNQGVLLSYDSTAAVWTVVADDLSLSVLDARYDATGAAATAQAASLQKTANLSDVANATTARGNLGAAATSHSHAESDVTSLTTDLTARVSKSTLSAKGSLLAASAAATPADVPVGADGTSLVADSTQTAGVAWKQRSRSLSDTHTDTIAGPNTTTETVLASQAIPTTVAAGDIVRMTVVGDMLNNSGSAVTYTFKLILGATTMMQTNPVSLAASSNRRTWRMDIDLLVAATNDQRVSADSVINPGATGWQIANGANAGCGRGSATEDLAAGKNLQLSVTMGTANALTDCNAHESFLEVAKR